MPKKKRYQLISGDVDSWQYGGTFLDTKENVLYHCHGLDSDPRFWDWGEPEHGAKQRIYEYKIEPVEGYVLNWCNTVDVSRSISIEIAEWELQSDAQKWVDIASYYGWYELDQYPIEMNKTEWRKMVGDYA